MSRIKLDLSNPMLSAAIDYAETGWPVLPLKAGTKAPMTIPSLGFTDGFHSATVDRERIVAAWTKFPNANIGIAVPEGVVPIDIDGAHDLSDEELPHAPSQQTAKGEHRLYQTDGRTVARQIKVRANVDLVTNGLLVVAPSVHPSGARYEGFDPLPRPENLPPAPEWVYGTGEPRERKTHRPDMSAGQIFIPAGSRDVELASIAGSMRNIGFGPGPIQAAFEQLDAEGSIEQPHGNVMGKADFARIATSIGRLKSTRLAEGDWPTMAPEAYQGLAGRVVDLVTPTTEGDPVAILAAVLTWFGAAVGNGPHFYVGSSRHSANLYAVVVGDTSKARKGITGSTLREVLGPVDPTLMTAGGLSTGEGLIYSLRDPRREWDKKKGDWGIADGGIEDKRRLLHESEFGRVLRVATRQASTLTSVLRQAWDGDILNVTVKGDLGGYTATGAHVSLLGNVTLEELGDTLTRQDAENGFANRILWLAVRRQRIQALLPALGDTHAIELDLREAMNAARRRGEVNLSAAAEKLWIAEYPRLSASHGGLIGKLTDRGEAQARRVALVYALLDRAPAVSVEHLKAALAVVDYAAQSAQVLARSRQGADPDEAKVLDALRAAGGQLLRTDISKDVFGRHKEASALDALRDRLIAQGKVETVMVSGAGRTAEAWKLR